jgi:hypothetical protein
MNYLSQLISFFAEKIFQYKPQASDPAYIKMIFRTVLEILILNLDKDNLPADFHRIINLLIPR